jgi:hypothetical protein
MRWTASVAVFAIIVDYEFSRFAGTQVAIDLLGSLSFLHPY